MFIEFVQSEFKNILHFNIDAYKGTAILIGFWAMENSNVNVYLCDMSKRQSKTEGGRERE